MIGRFGDTRLVIDESVVVDGGKGGRAGGGRAVSGNVGIYRNDEPTRGDGIGVIAMKIIAVVGCGAAANPDSKGLGSECV